MDGILIWMSKPSIKECKEIVIGPMKFLCSRKTKFDLNMQAAYNYNCYFVVVTTASRGAVSDFLSYNLLSFKQIIELANFLVPGLAIYGDTTYVNSCFLASPIQNSGSNIDKNSYSFYHYQLRIRIDCSFGMLVHRWAI